MQRPGWTSAALLAAIAVCGAAPSAHANERHFTYTYETATLPAGSVELEPWFTFRTGKDTFYNRFDQRLEIEYGVADSVMTALYLNYSATAFRAPTGEIVTEWSLPSLSWEWKFKFMDPVADPIGLALYAELGASPIEAEVELKLLLDKRIGDAILAFNAVLEPEFEFEGDETEVELVVELDLAAAWLISSHFSLGVEVRSVLVLPEAESLEHGALFAGLTLGYQSERMWFALSVLPQVASFAGASADSITNLNEFERVETRLIAGFAL